MKINYINIQGAILYGVAPRRLEKIRKRATKTFQENNIPTISTYQDGRNAVIAMKKNEVIGWIDFEDSQGVQQIHSINILPEYLTEGIIDNLIDQAIYELKNEKPCIAIPSNMLNYLTPSIEKYNWEHTSYTVYPTEDNTHGYNEYTKWPEKGPQRKKQIKHELVK